MVEFTIVFPVLIAVMMGVIQYGLVLNHQNVLTSAVATGAHELSISRGNATAYTDTINAIKNTAKLMLTPANLTITVSVNGTACSADNACSAALDAAKGLPATVAATYPCLNLGLVGIDYKSCILSSTLSMSVQ